MQARQVEHTMDALPEAYRTVFVLCALEEVPAREVAAMLGLSEATVRACHAAAARLLGSAVVARLESLRHDVFAFDGERCERMVSTVLKRIGQQRAR